MNKKIIFYLAIALLVFSQALSAKGKPQNVIFIIGDGMGLAQIQAGMVVNGNKLEMEAFRHIGLVKTYSHSHFTTDSGAGGTALACGVKTKNGMIGMGPDSVPVQSVLHLAENKNLSTGVVSA
ncbi:MAG: alkaline phosphatase, partial [Paludibacter sp.]|nr:alkaline phosphatase [Paludibacter sp.]